jgi:hypothetical protein
MPYFDNPMTYEYSYYDQFAAAEFYAQSYVQKVIQTLSLST